MKRILFALMIWLVLLPVLVSSVYELPADRKVDWKPGIPGGIPSRTTICSTINAATYGNGVTDATAAFQAAINSCPAGQVIYIPEGTYRLTNTLTISKGIVLRGAGPDKTRLISSSPSQAIMFNGGGQLGYIDIVSGYNRGSTSMTLATVNPRFGSYNWPVSVGSYLVIDQENSDNSTTVIPSDEGHEGACQYCGFSRCSTNHSIYCPEGYGGACDGGRGICEGGYRSVGQMIKVTAMNGNTITFEPELYWNFTARGEPKVILIYPNAMIEYAGIEDFYITGGNGNSIEMDGCAYCWVKNIESFNTTQRHFHSYFSYKMEIRDNYFHDAQCFTGNYGYGISLMAFTTDTLVENNLFDWLHDPIAQSVGGGGNVISYNYAAHQKFTWPTCADLTNAIMPTICHHGRHPSYNLFEGNVGEAFWSDFIHGESSHVTLYRNRLTGYFSYPTMTSIRSLWPIMLAKYSRYFSALGNVLGTPEITWGYELSDVTNLNCWHEPYIYWLGYESATPGGCLAEQSDPGTRTTLLRHGNFDYSTNSVVWNPGISDHSLPASLYLSSKPSWWGNLAWPAFGPDPNNPSALLNGKIPAQVRYEQISGTSPLNVPGDLNGDGFVNSADFFIVVSDFGKTSGFNNARSDTNNDNMVDIYDVVYVASRITSS
jgi:hypothetical protein